METMLEITIASTHNSKAAETGNLSELAPDLFTGTERFDLDRMLSVTDDKKATAKLVGARGTLIAQLRIQLNDTELKDWNVIKRWNEVLNNFERRITDKHAYQLKTGSIYQPAIELTQEQERRPAWKDMTKSSVEREKLRRDRQRDRKAGHSDAKQILYHRLKAGGRQDFEYLRGLKAVEAGIRAERQQMQATLAVLNARLVKPDNHNDPAPEVLVSSAPTLDDLISRELSVRGGKCKRLPHERLRKRGTQGMLKLLRDKTDRYSVDEERVLPWDVPVKKTTWWKRASLSVLRKRISCSKMSRGSIPSARSSISSEESGSTQGISLDDFPIPPTPPPADPERHFSSKWVLFPSVQLSTSSKKSEPTEKTLYDALAMPPMNPPTDRVKLSRSKRILLTMFSLRAQVKVPRRLRTIVGKK